MFEFDISPPMFSKFKNLEKSSFHLFRLSRSRDQRQDTVAALQQLAIRLKESYYVTAANAIEKFLPSAIEGIIRT